MEVNKNDIVTITIEDIGTDGAGIGKIGGYTLFVKDAIIGDIVEVKIMKVKKNYAFAKLEKVITPSPFRIEPVCEKHKQCGGCQIQAMSYEKQLEFKQNKVKNNLVRIGKFDEEFITSVMEPIIGMEEPYHYRNKAQFPIGTNKDGQIVTGFYAGRTHDIIPNMNCHLVVIENEIILKTVISYMEENHVSAYDEKTGQGVVRHVLIRKGFYTGELMVCIIICGSVLPKEHLLINKLCTIDNIKSISVSINKENTNVIMGKEIRLLWGENYITDYIGDICFQISPLSFYQVNPLQTQKLYDQALAYADLKGDEVVWDLYCGIGTISLFLSQKAKQVYGVEVVPEAIKDAKNNAEINGIDNVEFFVGRAEDVLFEKYRESNGSMRADVIVVDPPRKGCDEMCLATMLSMQPEKIVYVSCDSATLARDLRILCDGGYEVRRVRACDMFGMTVHVECVCLMTRNK